MSKQIDFGEQKFLKKLQGLEEKGSIYRHLIQPEGPVIVYALPCPFEKKIWPQHIQELLCWAKFWREGKTGKNGNPLWQVREDTKRHPVLGAQKIPTAVVVEDAAAAFELLGREKEMHYFSDACQAVLRACPRAFDWLVQYHQRIYAEHFFPGCISLARAFLGEIRQDCYLRELDIPGIDTKFLENHLFLARTLWNALFPHRMVKNERELYAEFHWKRLPVPNVCVRILTPGISLHGIQEFFVSAYDLARLDLPIETVFITENKVNGYAFPKKEDSLVLFGMGYGVLELVEAAPWLKNRRIYYWGDLDGNGFDMLSKLREKLPQTQSFLMTEDIWQHYRSLAVPDTGGCTVPLQNLSNEEELVWRDIRKTGLRLEQERIPLHEVQCALQSL